MDVKIYVVRNENATATRELFVLFVLVTCNLLIIR